MSATMSGDLDSDGASVLPLDLHTVSFTENVAMRFEAYGWQVIHVENGDTDLKAMYEAIEQGKAEKNKPTLIRLRTTIGFGSKLQGTHGVHGNPLKADDTQSIKKLFGFDPEKFFDVPAAASEAFAQVAERGAKANAAWDRVFESYKSKYPTEAAELLRRIEGKLPDGWEKCLPTYKPTDPAVASRKLSETVITKIAAAVPEFICGVSFAVVLRQCGASRVWLYSVSDADSARHAKPSFPPSFFSC